MSTTPNYIKAFPSDALAGVVVFLVALPLCLGVALASGAPAISGIVAGIVGGMMVAWLSGSQTSISGPAAGLAAVVAAQILALGSFEAFLVAVILAGVLQILFALLKAGSLAAFFPSSVIKGLLSAIGVLLILKQIPHLLGHDTDWFGDMDFLQNDGENTFSGLYQTLLDINTGPAVTGLLCLALLIAWDKTALKRLMVPAPLVVVALGIAMTLLFASLGGSWEITAEHLVQVPVSESLASFAGTLSTPDFTSISNPAILVAAVTIAVVASLETLLNLEAVDKLDPQKRTSPPNRELMAQGMGNITSGLLGGLPLTSVVVRSSVGIDAGGKTRITCFIHGTLLLLLTLLLPKLLNLIPLSCLAAILIATGFKLAAPALLKDMWHAGHSQFWPFLLTVVAIVMTDLLTGILIGLFVAAIFILKGNLRRPLVQVQESTYSGDIKRIVLSNHVSFLNRAALRESLHQLDEGSSVVLDARSTAYIDPDIIDLISEFEQEYAPAHEITVSRIGFRPHYELDDRIEYAEVATAEIQAELTPERILLRLKEGNSRFVNGQLTSRDPLRQRDMTHAGQYPLAVALACMDSRVHTETIFDLGLGDMFSIRIAGNVVSEQALGSMEYGCVVAGAKLILVLGHTRCGAVNAAVDMAASEGSAGSGFDNLDSITAPITQCVHAETETQGERNSANTEFVQRITELNVLQSMRDICRRSTTLRQLVDSGDIVLCGGIYNVETGKVSLIEADAPPVAGLTPDTEAKIAN